MSKIIIGTAGGKNIGFDIPELLTTRLLVQANSGGGKSWLLRRMAEQLFGKVQTIIIDPEGEFFRDLYT
jgi:DNA helicase HerA-like ATPase